MEMRKKQTKKEFSKKELTKKKTTLKPLRSEVVEDEIDEVPTVEGRRFKNIKTFHEMMEEGFMSPLSDYRSKTTSEIKDKISSFTDNRPDTSSEPIKTATKPVQKKSFVKNLKDMVRPAKTPKPDRENINSLKSEISSKMKELDVMLSNNIEDVAQQSQEVKQLLERLDWLLKK
jgi:hypothetical protein